MIASRLTPQEMRKESRRLIKNLSRRIERIEGLGSSAPQYAVSAYRELEKRIPKRLTELSSTELTTLYRDLRYINSLKSSTVNGAIQTQSKFEPIKAKLEALSPDTQKNFWDIYGKLYERTSGTMENFKYELFEANIDYIYGGQEVDKAVEEILSEYDSTLKELGGDVSDAEIKVLFTSKLRTLLK